METKTLENIEIMSVGTWHNGRNRPVTINTAHLDLAIARFNARPTGETVAIKLGHSSPAWNSRVADALGVPLEVLIGEGRDTSPTGLTEGMARLGTITALERRGDSVYARAEAVPAPIADMIETGLYTGVSPEVIFGFDGDSIVEMVLTGLAFLGEQDPAISELRPLSDTRVFARSSWGTNTTPDNVDKQRLSAIIESGRRFWNAFAGQHRDDANKPTSAPAPESSPQSSVPDDASRSKTMDKTLKERLIKFLGLAEDASDEDVMTAFTAFAEAQPAPDAEAPPAPPTEPAPDAGAGAEPPAAPPEAPRDPLDRPAEAVPSEVAVALAKVVERLDALEADRTAARTADRVAHYTRMAASWTALPGTPAEMGTRLAHIEATMGDAAVEPIVATYSQLNDTRLAANLMRPLGTSTVPPDSEHDPFEARLQAYMTEHKVDRPAAYRYFATTNDPEERSAFVAYRQRHTPSSLRLN